MLLLGAVSAKPAKTLARHQDLLQVERQKRTPRQKTVSLRDCRTKNRKNVAGSESGHVLATTLREARISKKYGKACLKLRQKMPPGRRSAAVAVLEEAPCMTVIRNVFVVRCRTSTKSTDGMDAVTSVLILSFQSQPKGRLVQEANCLPRGGTGPNRCRRGPMPRDLLGAGSG